MLILQFALLKFVARLRGFEPPTHGLEVRSSIHLSYRRFSFKKLRFPLCSMPFAKLVGASRFNGRPPAPKAGALNQAALRPDVPNCNHEVPQLQRITNITNCSKCKMGAHPVSHLNGRSGQPHLLGGVTKSRSLFLATVTLLLPRQAR